MQTELKSSMPHTMDEALPDVMMRVVSELYGVTYLIERIEPVLSDIHGEASLDSAYRIKVFQGIDLAVQKTRGLAEFIATVTAAIPGSWLIDVTTALNLVKLTDMQKSLGNSLLRHGHAQPLTEDDGDLPAV